jgi:hypothetical protein
MRFELPEELKTIPELEREVTAVKITLGNITTIQSSTTDEGAYDQFTSAVYDITEAQNLVSKEHVS